MTSHFLTPPPIGTGDKYPYLCMEFKIDVGQFRAGICRGGGANKYTLLGKTKQKKIEVGY